MPAPIQRMGKRFSWLLPHRGIGAGSLQSTDAALAPEILSAWESKVQQWSQDGSLLAAAQEALMLEGTPKLLEEWIKDWSKGKFGDIPQIVLLDGADMNGAMGAYATSTNTIYLNITWLENADRDAVISVLNEELGHSLDAKLNPTDTPGDEGRNFAMILRGNTTKDEALAHSVQSDAGTISVNGASVLVEFATAPKIRGNSLYTVVDGSAWTTAESNSVTLGGHLVTFNDASERLWLSQNIYGNPLHIEKLKNGTQDISILDGYFVGLNDKAVNGTFQWVGDNNTSWTSPSQYISPDNVTRQLYLQPNYEYGQVHSNSDGTGADILFDLGDSSEVYTAYGIFYRGIAEIPITSTIALPASIQEGSGRFTTTISLYAGNATTGNLVEGATVYWKVQGITTDDLISGALSGTGVISGGKLSLQHSLKKDQDIGEQFTVSVFSDSALTQQIGTSSSAVVSELNTYIRGNSLYTVVDGSAWTTAESNSVTLGGHLVTFNDASERLWLSQNIYGNPLHIEKLKNGTQDISILDGYFVGLNDKAVNGTFQWVGDNNTSWTSPSQYISPDNVTRQLYLQPNYEYGQVHSNSDGTGADILFDLGDSSEVYTAYGIFYRGIAEIPLASSITFSATPQEGGGVFNTSINLSAGNANTGNLAEGTQVYWRITGIQQSDLVSGYSLTGNGFITNGKLDVAEALVQDNVQENESFNVSVYSDANLAQQIGTTVSSVILADIGSGTTTASVTTTLASTISRLTLTGTGNINGTGNALNNYIAGNVGNNIINGGTGYDILVGGKGNDTYVVDSIYDTITENASEGTDTVQSSVTYTLGANIENLTLTGSASINGTGNALSNTINGNTGNNILDGGVGKDILTGLGGADTFRYTTLSDSLLSAYDRITDFAVGTDFIDGPNAISAANVKKLGPVTALTESAIQGVLTNTNFVVNGASLFTFGTGKSTQTFLALNDSIAGFSASTDAIIDVTGYTGIINNLSVI